MRIQQSSLTKPKKSHTPNRSFFKYNCPPNSKSQSPSKRTPLQTQYNEFIEGYTDHALNALKPVSQVFTEKQLAKMMLFEVVRKTKGEFYFKTIYQKSKYAEIKPTSDLSQWLTERKYFVFVISGQFNIYKVGEQSAQASSTSQVSKSFQEATKDNNNTVSGKCYIRSYGAQEHFGYQEYPLYWKEKLIVEAPVECKVILFPLQTFYRVFSNIINLAAIQLTAEFLKKIYVFKEVEMEKLLRISTFSQRIRTYPNTVIAQKGQKINHIIILYEGRVSLSDYDKFYTEETNGLLIGKKQIDFKKLSFQHEIKALIQCDLIVIPLVEFSKVSQIKHKLRDSVLEDNEKNVKSRKKMYSNLSTYEKEKKYSVTGYQTMEEQLFGKNASTDTLKQKKSVSLIHVDDSSDSIDRSDKNNLKSIKVPKYRPKTASYSLTMNNNAPKSIIYNDNGRQFFLNRVKTSMTQNRPQSIFLDNKSSQNKLYKSLEKQPEEKLQNVTMGEIYWAKFLNRKVQLQNKEITKIINARLPESILNENKEYAVMKPLVQKKSTYIKNYKRKIRHSHKINDLSKLNTEDSTRNAKFDLKIEPPSSKICMSSFMIDDEDP